jgi:hypothetical protein
MTVHSLRCCAISDQGEQEKCHHAR